MGSINTFYSDVVLGQVASTGGVYPVSEAKVTWSTTPTPTVGTKMSAGALLVGSDAAGYTWATVATLADIKGVLVDYRAIENTEDFADATQYDMVVGKRGMVLNKSKLTFSDNFTDANIVSAIAVLEALGIKVTDKVMEL